eukprot:CAMPEP_0172903454 /NCGR_PEP_ID=MMETSP1075-20121228/170580_1 /TAXON_ID=2916 /ORGANISM="Ceratium fusus, Strain PA161109" /LENGTH=371 /DNA_ID=CAMNT_0013760269 /DNA_START=1 /DNA_END=1112 /DNA_ORIENTATION=+
MLAPDERPEGTIRVHFSDNTYKTLRLTYETSVSEVVEDLCKRLSVGGRHVEPERHQLFIIAPGSQALRERRLLRDDKPLEIQVKGGSKAFKFLIREVREEVVVEQAGEGSEEAIEGQHVASTEKQVTESLPVPVADVSSTLKTGPLERLLEDGTWYACTAILDTDHLWYSHEPCGVEGGRGGGMACLLLFECDHVQECDDKLSLQVLSKGVTMQFKARSSQERNNWIVAIANQAALLKERNILLQANRIIAGVEQQRSSQHAARLEAFGKLEGLLGASETREMFLDFVKRDYEAVVQWQAAVAAGEQLRQGGNDTKDCADSCANSATASASQASGSWPKGLELQDLLACLKKGEPGRREGAAWDFAEAQLL